MTPLRVAVRGVDDDHVDAGLDERVGALDAIGAGTDGRAHAQPAALVLDGERVALGLQQILDGDEPDQLAVLDDEQLLDAMLVKQLRAPRSVDTPGGTVTSSVVMSALTGWSRFFSKRMSRAVRMPTGLSPSTTGTPEMSCSRMTAERLAQALRRTAP